MVRKMKSYKDSVSIVRHSSRNGDGGKGGALIPMTLPLRCHSSKYGGRRPAANRIAAMMPTIIIGHSIPRSCGPFGTDSQN